MTKLHALSRFILAPLLAVGPGCFVSRSMINEPLKRPEIDKLVPGQSTAKEAVEILGAPNEVVQLGSRTAYRYDYSIQKRAGFTVILVTVLNEDTRAKALGRLRRIEGQVQGLQRMIDNDAYCVDILLQISAVQGALEQVQKLLLGRHIESCVTDAIRSGSKSERQQKIEELLDVFARFGGK